MGSITFATKSQYNIWTEEIIGQLSDGYWENTKPYDHWKFWNDLSVGIGVPGIKASGYPKKTGYNLSALIEYVGDRMLIYGKAGKAGITNSFKIKGFEYAGEDLLSKGYDAVEEYCLKNSNKHGVKYISVLSEKDIEQYNSVTYKESDLKKDLAAIRKVMSMASSYNSSLKGDPKDYQRIEDIARKAGGDKNKAIQLAQRMAASISSAEKAYRRGLAAEDENYHSIAAVFFDRAEELGGSSLEEAKKQNGKKLLEYVLRKSIEKAVGKKVKLI